MAGAYQVESDTTLPYSFDIFIDDESMPGYEFYSASSYTLLPSNGATFYFAAVEMAASNASALQSAALTTTPPDMTLFNDDRSIRFEGMKNNQYFSVIADLQSLSSSGQTATQTRYEYRANAVVTTLYDPYGQLAGKLDVNGTLTTSFVYDLLTPNSSSYPEEGLYVHSPGTGEIKVEFADVVLNTDPTAQTPEVHVINPADPTYMDVLGINGNGVVSNNTTVNAWGIDVMFDGPSSALDSTLMPAGNLSLSDWNNAKVFVNGDNWYFEATITSLDLVQVPVVELFPADGTVHPLQNFDVGIRVNDQSDVVAITGTNNGQDITPYLGGCMIQPKVGSTQSVICPNTNMILMPGDNAVQLHIMLQDNVLDTSVNWLLSE